MLCTINCWLSFDIEETTRMNHLMIPKMKVWDSLIIDKHQHMNFTFNNTWSRMLISMLKYIKIYKSTPTCFDHMWCCALDSS